MGFQQNAGRILFSLQPLAHAPWHEQTVKSELKADIKHQRAPPNWVPRSLLHSNLIKCHTLKFEIYIHIYIYINNLFLKPFHLIMIPGVRLGFASISFSMDQNLDLIQRHQSIYWPEVTHWRILALTDSKASNQLLEVLYQLRSETAKSLYANFVFTAANSCDFITIPEILSIFLEALVSKHYITIRDLQLAFQIKKITSLTLVARNKNLKALNPKLKIKSNLFN